MKQTLKLSSFTTSLFSLKSEWKQSKKVQKNKRKISLSTPWNFLTQPAPEIGIILYLKALCTGIPEIMFLRGSLLGLFILSALLTYPQVLFLGFVAVISAYLFASVAGLGKNYLTYGFYTFNPFLSGLGIGYLFKLTPISLLLSVSAGILTFLFTWALSHTLRYYFRLPVLSLPFVLASWLLHLATFFYAGLKPSGIIFSQFTGIFPVGIEGFFRTLGFIFFLPHTLVGIVIAIALFMQSRILFLLAIMGYALGTSTHGLLVGTYDYIYYDIGAINYVLIAVAIGGVYLIPSPKSYILAGFAVISSSLVNDALTIFWSAVSIPAHAIAYNTITLCLLYVLGTVASPVLALQPQAVPEKTLDRDLNASQRYHSTGRTMALPFAGNWSVWQAFDGQWTHQGLWRYAYDFIIKDELEKTYSDHGSNLSDYYAYNKPVLSPITGQVVQVISDLPDCKIGTVDRVNNWGNSVIIWDDRGFYVEISHFAQHSLRVKAGERVEIGTFLGRCGNSGNSPQPHIHIQVQLTPQLGSATVPFSFSNITVSDEFLTDCLPKVGSIVSNLPSHPNLARILNFPLDQHLCFAVYRQNIQIDQLNLHVRMAADGSLYFDSGKGQLYFHCDRQVFMCHRLEGNDPYLKILFLALPKIPLVRTENLTWQDSLPVSLVLSPLSQTLTTLACSFVPYLASLHWAGKWNESNCISGTVHRPFTSYKLKTRVQFDELIGLQMIAADSLILSRTI